MAVASCPAFTPQEREILQALRHTKNFSFDAVARELYMSRGNVFYHADKIKRKTGYDIKTFDGFAACLDMMKKDVPNDG